MSLGLFTESSPIEGVCMLLDSVKQLCVSHLCGFNRLWLSRVVRLNLLFGLPKDEKSWLSDPKDGVGPPYSDPKYERLSRSR